MIKTEQVFIKLLYLQKDLNHYEDHQPNQKKGTTDSTTQATNSAKRPFSPLDLDTSYDEWAIEASYSEEDSATHRGPAQVSSVIKATTNPKRQRLKEKYCGLTILSDGTYLPTSSFPDLRKEFPGAFIQIINFLRLEDVPEALKTIAISRRKTIVLFVGTRDTYGATERLLHQYEGPNRTRVSLTQLSINSGLKTLAKSSTTPADSTYLCTIPPISPPAPTTDRQYRIVTNLLSSSIFLSIDTARYLIRKGERLLDTTIEPPTISSRRHFIDCIKEKLARHQRY